MFSWMKNNLSGVVLIAVAIGATGVLGLMAGCNVYDYFKMPVNTGVQQVTGSPPRISLSEYPDLRQQYLDKTARDLEKLDGNYTSAMFFADLGASIINTGTTIGQSYAATLPGGAALVGLLGAAGGLMISKPGDKKKAQDAMAKAVADARAEAERLMQEKIDSFNAALKLKMSAPEA